MLSGPSRSGERDLDLDLDLDRDVDIVETELIDVLGEGDRDGVCLPLALREDLSLCAPCGSEVFAFVL